MQPPRPRVLVLVAAMAVVVGLGACTSRASPGPRTPAEKTALPVSSYDLAIYLCPQSLPTPPCTDGVTTEEVTTVRSRLVKDAGVAHFHYLSERDSLTLARRTEPSRVVDLIGVGDLPAVFLVATSDGASLATLAAHYARIVGVASVKACDGKGNCSLSVLRSAGLIH